MRNAVLAWAGLICLMGGLVCVALAVVTTGQIMGINAYIKPAKFFVSTGILCWTMAWFLPLLNRPRTATVYAWMVVAVMTFELGVVVVQAAQGKLSHFNISTSIDATLLSVMGLDITLITLCTHTIAIRKLT